MTEERIINILLVEDSEVDVKITLRAFRNTLPATNVLVANDGIEALEFLRNEGRFAELEKYPKPDVILMDINMPKLNGFDALRKLKEDGQLRSIPVIMLTSSNNEQDVAMSYSGGAAGYIQKPVNYGDFCEVVKKFNDYWGSIIELPKQR
ncbi:MAG: response regulator [Candidatus Omnitrophica bacterium]|nr:response regulator [Candidatus Omnitrophota bacterium]